MCGLELGDERRGGGILRDDRGVNLVLVIFHLLVQGFLFGFQIGIGGEDGFAIFLKLRPFVGGERASATAVVFALRRWGRR